MAYFGAACSKKHLISIAICLSLLACTTSPLGRKQLLVFPEQQMDQMGANAYQQIKQNQAVVKNPATIDYVSCVSNAITAEVASDSQWEVTVFEDDSANAFALPSGKIGVNSGLLTVAQTPDQLAAVIGHEVGHVIAHHGNERMSIQYATNTGFQLLSVLAGEQSPQQQQIVALLGLGSQVGISLPFSRKHESEADLIGLELMAKAGFDPQASITLWQNMSAQSGKAPPEWLSTHPSNDSRIKALRKNISEASALYQQAVNAGKTPSCSQQ